VPLDITATAIGVRATIVAASVVRPAADHRACRKTADKARAKSATTSRSFVPRTSRRHR
jgi:hypothetical protein